MVLGFRGVGGMGSLIARFSVFPEDPKYLHGG